MPCRLGVSAQEGDNDMVEMNNQRRGFAPPEAGAAQQAPKTEVLPWDYQRHLEAEHHMSVDAEQGWPTTVKRYRLFRPMEGKRPERTLLAFCGTGPEALAHFYQYVHPSSKSNGNGNGNGRTYARPSSNYARRG
jgi:hypothetical protein